MIEFSRDDITELSKYIWKLIWCKYLFYDEQCWQLFFCFGRKFVSKRQNDSK